MTLLVMVVTGSGGLSVNKKQNEKVNMGPKRQKLGGDCDWGHARTTANKKEDMALGTTYSIQEHLRKFI